MTTLVADAPTQATNVLPKKAREFIPLATPAIQAILRQTGGRFEDHRSDHELVATVLDAHGIAAEPHEFLKLAREHQLLSWRDSNHHAGTALPKAPARTRRRPARELRATCRRVVIEPA